MTYFSCHKVLISISLAIVLFLSPPCRSIVLLFLSLDLCAGYRFDMSLLNQYANAKAVSLDHPVYPPDVVIDRNSLLYRRSPHPANGSANACNLI